MATQRNELILDTALVEKLKVEGYQLLEYTPKYVTVCAMTGYEQPFNLWLIESLEEALNAEFLQFLGPSALLRWNR